MTIKTKSMVNSLLDIFSETPFTFNGQRSVAEAWTNPSPAQFTHTGLVMPNIPPLVQYIHSAGDNRINLRELSFIFIFAFSAKLAKLRPQLTSKLFKTLNISPCIPYNISFNKPLIKILLLQTLLNLIKWFRNWF